MGILDIFKKWEPDTTREPPPKEDWPDHVTTLKKPKEFNKFIDKYPLAVVDFWAPWCQPCKMVDPRVRELSKMYKRKVAFGKVNVGDSKEIARKYHIMAIPNLLVFSYGKKVTKMTGVKQVGDYKDKIDGLLKRFEE